MELRINHRMLRQKDLARFAQIVEVGRRNRLQLIERLKPPLENLKIPRAQMYRAVSNEIEIQIVARGVVKVDRPDRNFGLTRNHLDSRTFEPMLGKDFGRSSEDSLPPRMPFPPMPFLNAHLTRNE